MTPIIAITMIGRCRGVTCIIGTHGTQAIKLRYTFLQFPYAIGAHALIMTHMTNAFSSTLSPGVQSY